MCGIAGMMSLEGRPVLEQEVRDMCTSITHRGPDDHGYYVTPEVGLGMRRLSIIDIASGRQPVRNEDGTVWVVYNGEIYNFRELRWDLEARGHVFYTHTDTEAIVHLYEEYGKGLVDHLRGMYAFALWDQRKKQLLIGRDRLGIKPLYYTEAGGRLLFASELKSILQMPEVERKLNWSAVSHLFSYLSTPPTEAILDGVHKLEPGHTLTASPGRTPVVERYWDVRFEPEEGRDLGYFVSRTRELLDESVRLHMVSDVPVGAFLSGGIDSSAVVATAAGHTAGPLQTFSIGFREAEYNELEHARAVAAKFRTDHHELTLGPEGLGELETLAWHLDEPFGDSSAIPTYMVSKLAARKVKVVLSGDGGDELFAGYEKYLVEQKERSYRQLPAFARSLLATVSRSMPDGMKGRNLLRHMSMAGAERYLDAGTLFRREDLKKLFRPEVFEMVAPYEPWRSKAACMESGNGNWLSALQRLDVKNYLPLDILTKVDRMSMAHSIETRVPLLDHKLVEFAATIPPEMNLHNGTTKYVLKQAMRGILPDSIIDRPKQGFAVPLGYWFRGKLGSYVRDLLLGDSAGSRQLFNRTYIENLVALHEKGRNLDLQLWTLISFELWSRVFLDRGAGKRACEAA
ncbi:MAG TPA: asparagine synthase (glutamine-hydrolyzing) [Bryobacteraceae bacterium]|nr:asparagine synthase (glutamine-hydrolyzing) [Bryobacteraceae bacterium]